MSISEDWLYIVIIRDKADSCLDYRPQLRSEIEQMFSSFGLSQGGMWETSTPSVLTASLEASKALDASSTTAPPDADFISVSRLFMDLPLISKMVTLSDGLSFDWRFLAIW